MTSICSFTSSTVKKLRATSSMRPRYANRGASAMSTAGITQLLWLESASSMDAGKSCRSVCTPLKSPASVAAVSPTPRSVTLSAYASGPPSNVSTSSREMSPGRLSSTRGNSKPVPRRSSEASCSATGGRSVFCGDPGCRGERESRAVQECDVGGAGDQVICGVHTVLSGRKVNARAARPGGVGPLSKCGTYRRSSAGWD